MVFAQGCDGSVAVDLSAALLGSGSITIADSLSGSCPPEERKECDAAVAIDCSNVSDTVLCHVMRLIDQVAQAALLSDIDPETFCPCKRVRENAPNASATTVVAFCAGGGR